MEHSTGVGVLDKLDLIFTALMQSPCSLSQLVDRTGISRPTAHRLASAMATLGYTERNQNGEFQLGPRIAELAGRSTADWLVRTATPILTTLRDETGQSAQLYRQLGSTRLCVASVEPVTGLRDSVPAGTLLPMTAGSAAQVLLAWQAPDVRAELVAQARFGDEDLIAVQKRGWSHSIAERDAGLASVSAPVFNNAGEVVAAVSVSGSVASFGSDITAAMVPPLLHAATSLTALIQLH